MLFVAFTLAWVEVASAADPKLPVSGSGANVVAIAEAIRSSLLWLAYPILLGGFLLRLKSTRDFSERLFTLVALGTLIVAIAGIRPAMNGGIKLVDWLAQNGKAQADEVMNEIWLGKIEEPNGGILNIPEKIGWTITRFFQKCGAVGRKFVGEAQLFCIEVIVAIAPLCLALWAIPATQSTAYKFAMIAFGTCLWKIGFLFVDMFIAAAAAPISGWVGITATTSTLSIVSSAPIAVPIAGAFSIGIMAFIIILAFVLNALYVATPFLIGAILSGINPATALMGAGAGAATMAAGPAAAIANKGTQLGMMAADRIGDAIVGNQGRALAAAYDSRTRFAQASVVNNAPYALPDSQVKGLLGSPISQNGDNGFVIAPNLDPSGQGNVFMRPSESSPGFSSANKINGDSTHEIRTPQANIDTEMSNESPFLVSQYSSGTPNTPQSAVAMPTYVRSSSKSSNALVPEIVTGPITTMQATAYMPPVTKSPPDGLRKTARS